MQEISSRAASWPKFWIFHAASNTISREALISARLSAIHCCTIWREPRGFPGASSRSAARLHIRSKARSQMPILRNGKARAFLPEKVLLWHAAILKPHLRVAGMVFSHVPHHAEIFDNPEARRVDGNQNLAGALVGWRIRICHSHQHREGGAVSGRGEPFVAVDDVIISVFHRGRAHPGGIGTGMLRLGHGKTTADFAPKQWFEIII